MKIKITIILIIALIVCLMSGYFAWFWYVPVSYGETYYKASNLKTICAMFCGLSFGILFMGSILKIVDWLHN